MEFFSCSAFLFYFGQVDTIFKTLAIKIFKLKKKIKFKFFIATHHEK